MVRFWRQGTIRIGLGFAIVALTLLVSPTGLPAVAQATQGDQGLQGGWAVDDRGNVSFFHSLSTQYPIMQEAGAGWVRVNFRLGECFQDWTRPGCNGKTALDVYHEVVANALNSNLRVLGLLSNEAWHGTQEQWTANNAETTGGNGDNPYIQDFAQKAVSVLAQHFNDKIGSWEVWNEPNAWTSRDAQGNPVGGSFIYPSNFAWLLKRSYEATKSAHPGATVISGGLLGYDVGGVTVTIIEDGVPKRVTKRGDPDGIRPSGKPPREPAPCPTTVPSGADYLCATYDMGINKAQWQAGNYPFDHVGQHLYIDQGGTTSAGKITTYLKDLRDAYLKYEGKKTAKATHITEVGWTTAAVSPEVQADNLRTAYSTFRRTSYVPRAYWFNVQDIPEADLFYGLVDPNAQKKPAFQAYQDFARY